MPQRISPVIGLTIALGVLTGCSTQSASINAYSDPGFHAGVIQRIAIFPVRNARLSPSEAQEANRRISMGLASRNPALKILSANEAIRLLNEKGLAADWARFLNDYSSSGVPDSKTLQAVGAALDVDAIFQAEMVNVVQQDGAPGIRPGQTRVTVRASLLGIGDGKLLWDATSDGIRKTATALEKAPPLAEAINLAINKLLVSIPF